MNTMRGSRLNFSNSSFVDQTVKNQQQRNHNYFNPDDCSDSDDSEDDDDNDNLKREINAIDEEILFSVRNPFGSLSESMPRLPGRMLKLNDSFGKAGIGYDMFERLNVVSHLNSEEVVANTTLSQLNLQIDADLTKLKQSFGFEYIKDMTEKSESNKALTSNDRIKSLENEAILAEDSDFAHGNHIYDKDNSKHITPAFQFLMDGKDDVSNRENIAFLNFLSDKEMNKASEVYKKIRLLRHELESGKQNLEDRNSSTIHDNDNNDDYSKHFINKSENISNGKNPYYDYYENKADIVDTTPMKGLLYPESISILSKKVVSNLSVVMDTLLCSFPESGEIAHVSKSGDMPANLLNIKAAAAKAISTVVTSNISPVKVINPAATTTTTTTTPIISQSVTLSVVDNQLKLIDQKLSEIPLDRHLFSSSNPSYVSSSSSSSLFKMDNRLPSSSSSSSSQRLLYDNNENVKQPLKIVRGMTPTLRQQNATGVKVNIRTSKPSKTVSDNNTSVKPNQSKKNIIENNNIPSAPPIYLNMNDNVGRRYNKIGNLIQQEPPSFYSTEMADISKKEKTLMNIQLLRKEMCETIMNNK